MQRGAPSEGRWLGLGLVVFTVAALLLPLAWVAPTWTPDSLEHVAIANALLHTGALLDPVQYHYFLDETAPLPAFAVRAPIVPLLTVIPLAAGLGLDAVGFAHALFSVLVAAVSYWLLCGFMRAWAAATAVIVLASTNPWLFVSGAPFNEVLASGVLVAIVASSAGVLRSSPRALVSAALVLLGWMTRPNLGLMVVAVAGGVVWRLGLRRALRHTPLYVFVIGFGVLYAAVHITVTRWTGVAPYEGYGVALEHLDALRWQRYGHDYRGAWAFLSQHYGAVGQTALTRVDQIVTAVCLSPTHYWIGWLIPIGWADAVARFRRIPLEQAVLILATLGFAAVQIAKYSDFEASRYPLQMLQCGVLAAFVAMGDRLPQLAPRRSALVARSCLLVVAGCALAVAAQRAWFVSGAEPPVSRIPGMATLCEAMHPDALVATTLPWAVHTQCGNATIRLPRNHGVPEIMDRFLAERRPGYLLDRRRRLRGHLEMEELARADGLLVLRVPWQGDLPPVWTAPPPVSCTGRDECQRRDPEAASSPPAPSPESGPPR